METAPRLVLLVAVIADWSAALALVGAKPNAPLATLATDLEPSATPSWVEEFAPAPNASAPCPVAADAMPNADEAIPAALE